MLSSLGHFISIMALELGLKIVKILEDGSYFFMFTTKSGHFKSTRLLCKYGNWGYIWNSLWTIFCLFCVYILCEFVQKKRIKSDHQFAKENVWKEEKMGNICHMSSLYVRCKGMSVRISVFLSLIVLRFTEK